MNLVEQWLNYFRQALGVTTVGEEQERRARELAAQGVVPPGAPGSSTRPMGPAGAGAALPGLPNYVNQGAASGNPDASGLPTTLVPSTPDAPGAPGTPTGPPKRRQSDLPNANPTTDLQRAQNELRIREWALEDARQAAASVAADATAAEKKRVADAVAAAESALNSQQTQVRQYESDQRAANTKPAAGTDLGYTLETITTNQGKRNVRVWWKADGNGGKSVDTAKGDKGVEDIGGAESAVDTQTAQLNLQRLQQQLAAENDPLKKEQLRVQVQTAQFALEQARSKAPLDQATAQLAYDRARTAYEQETSPEAKELKRVALEQARVALQQAQQTLNKPTESTQDGYLVRVAPGGELSRVDLLTPEQRRQKDEDDARKRETEARGTLPTNAYAALQQETQRLQGRAQDKLAELTARQQRGELSAEQASNQFQTWFQGNVKAPLEGLRASAEEAQRAERAQVEERNRVEDIRVQQANQQREQAGYQAGESARSALIGTFPSARSSEFAQQYGANVAAMSQRAQGRTAEERMAAPRSPGYTPQALDAARIQAVMPSPDAIAAAARQRALAAIAPTVAVRAGFTAPALPTAPDIQGLLGALPYRGPLSGPPLPSTGLLPTEGRGAVDLGTGYARTYYGPNGEVYGPDWRITP